MSNIFVQRVAVWYHDIYYERCQSEIRSSYIRTYTYTYAPTYTSLVGSDPFVTYQGMIYQVDHTGDRKHEFFCLDFCLLIAAVQHRAKDLNASICTFQL